MIVPLSGAVADACGGKAGALGALLRAGLPVPDGFVVTFAAYVAAVRDLDLGRPAADPDDPGAIRRAIEGRPVHAAVAAALGRALDELGDPPVAVRSSASNEDTGHASAAGQHESFLAVRGASAVADAVRDCWASLFSPRAIGYRDASGHDGRRSGDLAMAVIVQRHVDAEVSGVMFTPADPDGVTGIEASWGLGPSVVGGTVTPDAYRVAADGSVVRTIADKRTRLDRHGARLVTRDVPAAARRRPAIDDATATRLAALGRDVAAVLGGPQDIEWAIADGRVWLLQARPVTAEPPPPPPAASGGAASARTGTSAASGGGGAARSGTFAVSGGGGAAPAGPSAASNGAAVTLTGTPGSRGTATGAARVVRGPGDFSRVRPGDILVCPFTDPAWTPLLRIAAGVVTETGGVLSHAAIVAREHGIPAVLGIPDATRRLRDDTVITLDGTTGTVTATDA
ncbi:PEP/pyruvate-binding domain-containing protein [Nonomuraea rhodomycinica]|uniref:Pyruvate, phosphate dikinase n=1 Tax=Nonomuraea rhodomycinica TaxID=1712872 RepID=A0A7Y6IJG4_9ACTN|nr:PEP/pyruvate-binding domain-containing protein [Nonomuraea rhodomycinica]NUW39397.1 pyruvate, phosphate dikinase [Nonomuraea rhodomycinica]